MRVLAFLAISGSVLVALLFLADAALDKNGSPAIVTSQRTGLPEPTRHSDPVHIFVSAPAPEPDMTSRAVLDAQPKPGLAKIESAVSATRAEAPSVDTRAAPIDDQQGYRHNTLVDRLSISGQ
jgi:hypothetical protein